MLDPDIRNRVEGALLEGETLLWAEKTNHDAQDHGKNQFQLTKPRRRGLMIIWVLSVIGLIVIFNMPNGVDDWGTPTQRILTDILIHASPLGFVLPMVLFFLAETVKGRIYNIGAYALTNKRLFELDYELNIIRHHDASRVKSVYGMEGVTLKPIGSKGRRSYQLGLMDNNVLTINYLHRQISEARWT